METGPYFCKHHADRLVVAPIALRLCEQCKADALARYAEQADREHYRLQDEQSPDGRSIYGEMMGRYKPDRNPL
jgi:hypothetical protein